MISTVTVLVVIAVLDSMSMVPIALVELENGIRVMVQVGDVENPDSLHIGMPVRLEFRRISWDGEAGVIFYGHKAVPA